MWCWNSISHTSAMWSDGITTLGKATNCVSSSCFSIGIICAVFNLALSINIWSNVPTNPAVKLVYSGMPQALVSFKEWCRSRSGTTLSLFSAIQMINELQIPSKRNEAFQLTAEGNLHSETIDWSKTLVKFTRTVLKKKIDLPLK